MKELTKISEAYLKLISLEISPLEAFSMRSIKEGSFDNEIKIFECDNGEDSK